MGTGVVERYLECLAAHDWDGLAATIADDGLISHVSVFFKQPAAR